MIVTLNPSIEPDPDKVVRDINYHHPCFDLDERYHPGHDGHDEHDEHAGQDELAEPSLDDDYTDLDAEAQESLRDELQARLGAHLVRGRARVVVTDNVRTMLSIKRGQGVYTFRLHHMFVDAPPLVLRAIANYAEQQDREAAELLRAFIDSNDEAIRSRVEPRPVAIDTQGRWHNLQAIFDEINAPASPGALGPDASAAASRSSSAATRSRTS